MTYLDVLLGAAELVDVINSDAVVAEKGGGGTHTQETRRHTHTETWRERNESVQAWD